MFFKIGVLKKFSVFTRKHQRWSLNKIADLKSRKETPTQAFSRNYCKIFKNTVFAEYLQWLQLFFSQIDVI